MRPLFYSVAVPSAAVIAGIILYRVLFSIMSRIARRTSGMLDDSLVKHCRRPSRLLVPLLTLYLSLQFVTIPAETDRLIEKAVALLLVFSAAWLLIRLTNVLEDLVLSRYDIRDKDNLRARKVYTQFRIIRKMLIVMIVLVALASVLLSFEKFRQLGAGLLASAGLAGIVLGLAARPVLSNLLAGLQIALAEPIRLEDVVIVENEWGWIEEITLSYVVVRIWDLRRLVLPISYFLEKPFQNWTRQSADLIGSVSLYVDYTVPVRDIRNEFDRILRESKLWKGDVSALQVVDATEKTMQIRTIMDAADSSAAWDLRCEVREKLIDFIQRKYPDALPKVRAEFPGKK
jgi:small-conductance mechanosensitive channel